MFCGQFKALYRQMLPGTWTGEWGCAGPLESRLPYSAAVNGPGGSKTRLDTDPNQSERGL
jgi:hypothetical protein